MARLRPSSNHLADPATYDPAVPAPRLDACPGALTLHEAADGLLARVRLPGGLITGEQVAALAGLFGDFGDGRLELTSRGNVQLRALTDPGAVAEALAAVGLLPSSSHERVRNIVASPLAGIDGSHDVTDVVHALDAGLCGRPRLAELSGRFLFAVDDGRGDMASLKADVTLGFGIQVEDALEIAEAFLDVRAEQGSAAWRISELEGGVAAVAARIPTLINWAESTPERAFNPVTHDRPAGVVAQPDGRSALVVLAPLGRLDGAQLRWLAQIAGARGLRITPWRSVVIPDLEHVERVQAEAAELGLGIDAASPWYRVSACTGMPGCAKALADVQHDAREAADRWRGRNVRWSGCERRCGRPSDTDIDVIATAQGYTTAGAGID